MLVSQLFAEGRNVLNGAATSGIGVGATVRVGLCVAHHPWPRLF